MALSLRGCRIESAGAVDTEMVLDGWDKALVGGARGLEADVVAVVAGGRVVVVVVTVYGMPGRESLAVHSGHMLGSCYWQGVGGEGDSGWRLRFGTSGEVVGCWGERCWYYSWVLWAALGADCLVEFGFGKGTTEAEEVYCPDSCRCSLCRVWVGGWRNRRLEGLEDGCCMPRNHCLLLEMAPLGRMAELDEGRYLAAAGSSASDR